jgi:hypothetical protein
MTVRVAPIFMTLLMMVFLFLYPVTAQAQSGDEMPCGMEATATGMQVEPYNGEICPEDIAYQSSYLIFSEVLSNPAFRPFVLWFVSEDTLDSEFTLFANETIGVSIGVYFLFSAVALLSWSLFIPIMAFKGYQYYMLVQKTGHWDPSAEDEQSNMDSVKLVSYLLFLIFLMLPAGATGGKDNSRAPLTIGQVAAIIGILPAHQGGNILYSTYLHSVNLSSSEVNLKEDQLLPMGEDLANRFIEGEMCQINTRNALFNLNAKPGTEYFDGSNWFVDVRDKLVDRYDQCLAYTGNAQEGLVGDLTRLSVDKSFQTGFCNQVATEAGWISSRQVYYNQDLYGYNHTCMQVHYDTGLGRFASVLENDGEDGVPMEDTAESLAESYSTFDEFLSYRAAITPLISGVLEDEDLNSTSRYTKLNDLFVDYADNILLPRLSSDTRLNSGSNQEKQIKHLAVNGALLGNTVLDASFWTAVTDRRTSGTRQYKGISSWDKDDHRLGVDALLDVAREVAVTAQKYHCAVNWSENTSTRQMIARFNQAEDTEEVESLLSSENKMQCIEFLEEDERGDTDFDRYITYPVNDPRVFSDLEQMGDGTWQIKRDNQTANDETHAYMVSDVAERYYKSMQLNRFLLAGYTVAVKKAMADSLRESLSVREAESKSDEDLRGKGWGIMGGALLYLSQNRQSSAHVGKSLQGTLSINSGGSDERYVDRNAFGDDFDENKEMLIRDLFSPVDTGSLFMLGETGTNDYPGPNGILDEEEEAALIQQLFYYLEGLFLGPIDHIKAASGMPIDESLAEGLRGCFDDGGENCLSGGKHPIVAMSDFGHDMMDNMLTMMITSKIVNVIHSIVSSSGEPDGAISGKGGSGGGDKGKNSWSKKAGKFVKSFVSGIGAIAGGWIMVILKVLSAVLTVAKIILDALYPLFIVLFVGGAIFAYIIPMMAYVYGFMMMLLSIVGVVIIGIVIPFYVLSKMWYIDKEYQHGFKKFYEEMVGPYLTPLFFVVAAIVSWTLIVVIMYGVNTTFALLYQGLGSSASSGWGISSFVLYIMMYVMYFVAVFVLFRFGLGIMKTMPDLLKEKVGLKKSNDDAYIESLGFEQYVNAQVMRTIGEMPAKAAGRIAGKMGGKMTDEQLANAVALAEEQAETIRQHGGPQAFAAKMDAFEKSAAGQKAAQEANAESSKQADPDLEPSSGNTQGGNEEESQKETGPLGAEPPAEEPQGPDLEDDEEMDEPVQDKDDLRSKARGDRESTGFERDPDMDGPTTDEGSSGSGSSAKGEGSRSDTSGESSGPVLEGDEGTEDFEPPQDDSEQPDENQGSDDDENGRDGEDPNSDDPKGKD